MEMDKNRLRGIIIAAIMGLLAAILTYVYLQQEKAKLSGPATIKPSSEESFILQATKNIPRGQIIEKDAVVIKKAPANFVQPGALTNLETALGKMSLVDILAGEQITSSKIATSSSYSGQGELPLSMVTPSGKRAVTIPMEPLMAVGGMVRPGDYVDILGTFPLPQAPGGQPGQVVTITLFQNVLVLAVGSQLRETAQHAGRASREEPSVTTASAQTITFALPPQEAELISFAQEQGRLKLILRPPLDTQTQPLPVATAETLWQYILSMQGIQLPQQPEPEQPQAKPEEEKKPSSSLEVYRGGKK